MTDENFFDEAELILVNSSSNGIRPGLERVSRLLKLLGNPQDNWPAIHVVGTNGKGSTCAFLSSVFAASGYTTALYTSPHLESPGERLLINGHQLKGYEWLEAVKKISGVLNNDNILQKDPPSYFELVTAAAFMLACKYNIDIGIIEAGLGGRLDATNTLGRVECSVIASISMDHMDFLGSSLENIASEKFAVVRKNKPACFMGDNKSLIPLFKNFCEKNQAIPFVVSEQVQLENVNVTDKGCYFDFHAPELDLKGVNTSLIGTYQINNSALALSALSCVMKNFRKITASLILDGMKKTEWPGRLEVLSTNPMVVLDGGHNSDGVKNLADSIKTLWPDKKLGIVYAVMRDKDYISCLKNLSSLKPSLYATEVPDMQRSLNAEELLTACKDFTWNEEPKIFKSPLEAVEALHIAMK